MKKQIRAITLWRPWAYAVAYLGKDIENRSWNCYLNEGDCLAIHAGKKWDIEGAAWIDENFGFGICPPKTEHVHGAVIAVAKFGGNVKVSSSRWFVGPVGWQLYDVIPIDPVKVDGTQGLWKLDGDVLTAVCQLTASAEPTCQLTNGRKCG